jgi:hypothetical protein
MTLKDRLGKLALTKVAIGLTVIGLALAPATAHAAGPTGTYGPHDPSEVDCNPILGQIQNVMLVHSPAIQAAYVPLPGNIINTTPVNHNQWVAYRPTLLRYDATRSVWIQAPASRWKAWLTNNDASGSVNATQYYEWVGNQWIPSPSATIYWNLQSGSAYRVSIEYYWYPDPQVHEGRDVIVPTQYTYVVGGGYSQQPSCSY